MDKLVNHHQSAHDWKFTSTNEPRGYIDPISLRELWFHTGTICNLSCPFCLEGSKPGDDRLNRITFADAQPFIDEALSLGVERFSFTGGEPFVVKDFIRILDHALNFRSCLVLTNATDPLIKCWEDILPLRAKSNVLHFRVSLDFPDPQKHDAGRGSGNFTLSLSTIEKLHAAGFAVSIARQRSPGENLQEVDRAYQSFLKKARLPFDTRIVSFPEFLRPAVRAKVPEITETCMTKYHTQETRAKFMCSFSKMVIKRQGQMRVTACTLVDDDEDYDSATSLRESMGFRVMLKHHRCYSCFSAGASCSEL